MARTWHVQLGIFWIATAWLAAGLFIGPAVSGVEPKGQRLGVNVLFVALLVVVVGSMAGQWLSVKQHARRRRVVVLLRSQGYEYVDLGRFWQIAAARRAVPLAGADGASAAAGAARPKASSGRC